MTRYVTLLSMLLLSTPAIADDPDVYESIDELDIGRVFLTAQQRHWLDEQRQPGADTARARQPGSDRTRAADTNAAGYIIRSSGPSKAWTGEDFEDAPVGDVAAMRFPGDVRVVRHEPQSDAANANETDEN